MNSRLDSIYKDIESLEYQIEEAEKKEFMNVLTEKIRSRRFAY